MKTQRRIAILSKYILWAGIVAAPVLLLCLQSARYHVNAFMSHPVWSDEVAYWRLLYSMRKSGFGFGHTESFYGGFARIGSFGSHGIATLFSYGWYILLFPVKFNSITIANVLCSCAAFLALVCLVRPSLAQSAAIFIVTLFFQPIALYLGTSMMEMPCYAVLILYFSLFVQIYRKKLAGEKVKRLLPALLILTGVWAGCLRICYVVVLFPAVFMLNDFKIRKKLWLSMALYVAGAAALYFVESLFTAAYPFGYLYSLSALGIRDKAASLCRHFLENVKCYLIFENPAQTALRYLLLLLLGLFFVYGVEAWRNRKAERAVVLLSCGVAGAGLIAAICLLYDVFDWRDYRTFAPVLFVLILTLIVCCEKKYLSHVCLVLGLYLVFSRCNHMNYLTPDRCAPVQVDGQLAGQMESFFENKKCDMVIAGIPWDLPFFSTVPAKIGITYLADAAQLDSCDAEYFVAGYGADLTMPEHYEYIGEISGYGYAFRYRK